MVALGAGAVGAAMLYLFTHAFFKALLFLSAGSVIHATEEQEVDKLGGLWEQAAYHGTGVHHRRACDGGFVPIQRLLGEGRDSGRPQECGRSRPSRSG